MTLPRRTAVVAAALALSIAVLSALAPLSPTAGASSALPRSAEPMVTAAGTDADATRELHRIRAHFDSVLTELGAVDVAPLPPAARSARSALLVTLRTYAAAGVFPHNYDFADAPTPYFVDRKTGTLCAVAFLLASTGRRDIVDRVARRDNNVWVAQLAGDSAFTSWLGAQGLTLAEAARIQVPYAQSPSAQRREMALALAAPVSLLTAASVGTWNAWGNANGHSRVGAIAGLSAGVLAAAFNGRYLNGDDLNGAVRGVATAGVAIGGLSAAFSTRSLLRHGRFVAARAEAERARHVAREEVQASITPIVPLGRNGGAGLNLSVRF